ncbi:acyl-ACP--UDP-N-acetylglucosamine O-acyltransferase [Acuticoccus yangtzensis]|uniref:acyl-ACP--UDP-N-acetylglucosamine O-acyltransferase n=1 Tax=Acuticoccus yangtzensis TaxID=1443441 RepID=UPI000949529E|nr:acyl-ACP--UDP-N-acetylglucosamine O-acyltransferase [Acuticoccus yangtzensis]
MAQTSLAARHPTAIVEDGAQIADGVKIGPNAVIGPHVVLAEGVQIGANVVVSGHTTIGPRTRLYPGAVVGEGPQDFSYKDEPTELVIGADCTVRELVTMNVGTAKGHGRTVIGDNCYFMIGSHVGHDCTLGNGVVLSNHVLLGGHCQLDDFVLIGGQTAVLQRSRIGAFAFVAGLAGVTNDVVPYAYATGRKAWIQTLNLIGLKRRGFDRAAVAKMRAAYAMLFDEHGKFEDRTEKLREAMAGDPVVDRILAFIDQAPRRPYMSTRRDPRHDGPLDQTGDADADDEA